MHESLTLSVAACYDAAADHYDAWAWQKMWGATEWPLIEPLLGNPQTVLEIGIGTGAIAEKFLNRPDGHPTSYTGLDISGNMLARCRERLGGRATLHEGDASLMCCAELGGPFDLILGCRILNHIPALESIFLNMAAAMTEEARLILTDIDPRHGYSVTRLPTGQKPLAVPTFKHTPERVLHAAREAGFDLVHHHPVREDQATAPDGALPASLVGQSGPLLNIFMFEKRVV